MRPFIGLVLTLCVLASASEVLAQFRGRGSDGAARGSSGDRSREGAANGGRERGAPRGRPGGPGGDRSARLEGFLRSMDANNDGIIQESEVPEERLRMFRFLAERAGLDPSKGVPIAAVVESMGDRARERPPRGDTGDGRPPGETAPTPATSATAEDRQPQQAPEEPPLVPGFDVRRQLEPVPGFGTRINPQPRIRLGGSLAASAERRTPVEADRRVAVASARKEHPAPSDETVREESALRQRASYRFLAPHERLPQGLPEWFIERDVNMDGQVTMAEFARDWTDEKVEKFFRYDRNNDGVITVEEALNPFDEFGGAPTGDGQVSTGEDTGSQTTENETSPADDDSTEQEPDANGAPRAWWLEP